MISSSNPSRLVRKCAVHGARQNENVWVYRMGDVVIMLYKSCICFGLVSSGVYLFRIGGDLKYRRAMRKYNLLNGASHFPE